MTKILLVDDSKFLRLATERALARAGYDVSSARDGEQALEIARNLGPDLILLDMLLPKLPGPEVLKALKKDPRTADIPVVVVTGLSQKNASRLQHDGAFGYLEKSELALDKGCESLLAAVANIIQQLPANKPVNSPVNSSVDCKENPNKRDIASQSVPKNPKSALAAKRASRS
jgi:CheY-like chemotaxis protein